MSSYLLLLPIFKVFFTDEIFRRLAQLIDLLSSALLALLPSWCCGKRQKTFNMLHICIQKNGKSYLCRILWSPRSTRLGCLERGCWFCKESRLDKFCGRGQSSRDVVTSSFQQHRLQQRTAGRVMTTRSFFVRCET